MALEDLDPAQSGDLPTHATSLLKNYLAAVAQSLKQTEEAGAIAVKKGMPPDWVTAANKPHLVAKFKFLTHVVTLAVPYEAAHVVQGFHAGKTAAEIEEAVGAAAGAAPAADALPTIFSVFCDSLRKVLSARQNSNVAVTADAVSELPADGSKTAEALGEAELVFLTFAGSVGGRALGEMAIAGPFEALQSLCAEGAGGLSAAVMIPAGLDKIPVSQVMKTDYPSIDVKKTIGDAYDLMEELKLESLPIVQDGKVVKVISKNNVETIRSVFFDAPGQEERISRLMCLPLKEVNPNQKLFSVKADQNLKEAVAGMAKLKINAVPIVSETGALVGYVTSNMILKLLG